MSRLEDVSVQYRKREVARNEYNNEDQFNAGHENALADGDEKGKGELEGHIGSKTDIEQRKLAETRNKFNRDKPYDDSTA